MSECEKAVPAAIYTAETAVARYRDQGFLHLIVILSYFARTNFLAAV